MSSHEIKNIKYSCWAIFLAAVEQSGETVEVQNLNVKSDILTAGQKAGGNIYSSLFKKNSFNIGSIISQHLLILIFDVIRLHNF